MASFVGKDSIVRRIWGKGDTILMIFAGAAAEFALNKSVDWLYFTGRLPSDPLGRLFSTVSYAHKIVFSEEGRARGSIDGISAIHRGVEEKRGVSIPAEAYLDVLFMLVDYSIRGFELMERKLTDAEKDEVFDVFRRVGEGMRLKELPADFRAFARMRDRYMAENLVYSPLTEDLFRQYRKNLGPLRFRLLRQVQRLLVPVSVRRLLRLPPAPLMRVVIWCYKVFRFLGFEKLVKYAVLPRKYREQVFALDM
jgi:uncharacterized protein (DUF2236 family)